MQHDLPPSLPEPDSPSAAHCQRAADYIGQQVEAAGGSIGFAEFMQHALYAPGFGYYTAGSTKFGAAGDFVTAPEVSSVFGRVLARQCAEVLGQIDGGVILEYGAGSGKLAADVLEALAKLDALPAEYLILEVSPDLCQREQELLQQRVPELVHLVRWLDLPPESLRGVIIANEVLDSFPVERFVRRDAGVMQQRVVAGDTGFEWCEVEASPQLANFVQRIERDIGATLPDGYTSEACLALSPWIGGLAGVLDEGVAFLFDYGVSRREYYAIDRNDGWLRCHFRHHAHNDPLILPGIQDLTAWVDFTTVASTATHAGLDIAGYTPQAQFMMAGGLEEEMRGFETLEPEQQLRLSQQVKTLTLPGEMGEHFKCLALRDGAIDTPSAFSLADRTHTL